MEIKTYTIRPGDTLSGIASQHGLKHWQDILFDQANTAIRERYKSDPKLVRPGDTLVIPAKVDLAIRVKERKRLEKIIARQKESRKELEDSFATLIAENRRAGMELKRFAGGVDTAGTVITMIASLGMTAATTAKTMRLSGEALKEANKEFMKDFVKGKVIQTTDLAAKVADEAIKEPDSMALVVGKSVAKAWSDMWSPSFWAAGYVDIMENKRWDPTKWSPDAMQRETEQKLQNQLKTALAALDARVAQYEAALERLK